MTVTELIAILQTYPQDILVVVDGYEGGYQSPSAENITPLSVTDPYPNQAWIFGDRDEGDHPAVLISRRHKDE